jgi:hypothetical protein
VVYVQVTVNAHSVLHTVQPTDGRLSHCHRQRLGSGLTLLLPLPMLQPPVLLHLERRRFPPVCTHHRHQTQQRIHRSWHRLQPAAAAAAGLRGSMLAALPQQRWQQQEEGCACCRCHCFDVGLSESCCCCGCLQKAYVLLQQPALA